MPGLVIQSLDVKRSILSWITLAILVAPAAFPQSPLNEAKPTNPKQTGVGQGLARNNFVKTAAEFAPAPWPPLDVDAGPPTVTSNVPCPLSNVLRGATQHAVDFAANLEKFTATEIVQSTDARKDGSWNRLQGNTFSYLALVSHPRNGVVYVAEERAGNENFGPPPVRTAGLAAAALIFHPQTINDFGTTCEGMGEWDGKPAWIVHFAQKKEVPPHFQSIRVNNKFYGVKLKGRAWIASDNFEIVHIDTDLSEQIPQIRLLTEHTSIEYGPVGFKTGNLRLWLPQEVEFYMDVGGHRYFNHHKLSNFLLFSVDTKQETRLPRLPE
jgi:hypothetical protein